LQGIADSSPLFPVFLPSRDNSSTNPQEYCFNPLKRDGGFLGEGSTFILPENALMLPRRSIKLDLNVPVEMRDGTILRADIFRHGDKLKHPAIFMRTYGNKNISKSLYLNEIDAAQAGYALVIQDIRGMYASDRVWEVVETFQVEGKDGSDTVKRDNCLEIYPIS
jgi:predicted acyl esterase